MCCVPTVAAVPSSRRRPENHIRCVCVQLCVEKGCVPWSSGTCAPGELDAVIILIWMGKFCGFSSIFCKLKEVACVSPGRVVWKGCVPAASATGFRAVVPPATLQRVRSRCASPVSAVFPEFFPNNFCVCPRYWPPATFLTHGNVCARTMCVEQRWCVPTMPRFVCPRDRWFGKGVSPALHLNNFYVCPRYLCVPATPAATPWCGIGVSPLLFFRCEFGFPANRTR